MLTATIGIDIVCIAAVDNDVALGKQRLELINDRIDRGTGLHHDHDSARRRKAVDEGFQRVVALDAVRSSRFNNSRRTAAEAIDEFMSRLSGSIVNANGEPFVGHVHDQVLSHNRQADQADIMS